LVYYGAIVEVGTHQILRRQHPSTSWPFRQCWVYILRHKSNSWYSTTSPWSHIGNWSPL